jgi:ribosomal protein S20
MAINKVMNLTAMERDPTQYGPKNSIKRLEVALKSGNMELARHALESVIKELPIGKASANELTKAVSTLSQALQSGDISKATQAFSGVKTQTEKFYEGISQSEKTQEKKPEAVPAQTTGVANGRLDILA